LYFCQPVTAFLNKRGKSGQHREAYRLIAGPEQMGGEKVPQKITACTPCAGKGENVR